ncbi:MAG: malonyl-ACP O-methyltransferase BioC [Gammaproteobacteria bacterium]|nr:malonyl-ACP O-methyltransferase BioC [Gammaproteobacteria bacterium]
MNHRNTHNAPIDKQAARQSFNKAASTYDGAAALQREVGLRLLERMHIIRLNPKFIIDVGCGTGYLTIQLRQFFKQAHVIGMDFAEQMLGKARSKLTWRQMLFGRRPVFICGDAERLPIADQSVDLIFSNLTLQWCNDLTAAFSEFRRVLKPGGLLMFSSLGPDTLKELRHSWRTIDNGHHVHPFIDMHDVGDALLRARLADPVMDMEYFTLTFKDGLQLMRELKMLGAHNAQTDRPHNLTGKTHLRQMLQAYERFRNDGRLPATYEIVYGHAWRPETKPLETKAIDTVQVDFQRRPGRTGK